MAPTVIKSKKLRKVFRKTPGGETKVSYRNKKPKQHSCANCGADLKGIPRLQATKMKNMPKTKKRPERPYGGFYCSSCSRKKIIEEARS